MSPSQWRTHNVELCTQTVIKRFPPGHEGNQAREWSSLELLAEYAPGLAPRPLECGTDATGGFVRMSRVPGEPLRGRVLDRRHLAGLVEALRTLHTAIPHSTTIDIAERPGQQAGILAQIERWRSADVERNVGREVASALRAGTRWLDTWFAEPDGMILPAVFGPGDGNLANYLWDGERVRVVDFEDAGRSDRPYEIAEVTEHVASWQDSRMDVAAFVELLELTDTERRRLGDCRRLLALVWLFLLSMDDPAHPRNPPGTAELQAVRLRSLLDST